MILAFTGGLWLMSFLGLRYPLAMLPVASFECLWKTRGCSASSCRNVGPGAIPRS